MSFNKNHEIWFQTFHHFLYISSFFTAYHPLIVTSLAKLPFIINRHTPSLPPNTETATNHPLHLPQLRLPRATLTELPLYHRQQLHSKRSQPCPKQRGGERKSYNSTPSRHHQPPRSPLSVGSRSRLSLQLAAVRALPFHALNREPSTEPPSPLRELSFSPLLSTAGRSSLKPTPPLSQTVLPSLSAARLHTLSLMTRWTFVPFTTLCSGRGRLPLEAAVCVSPIPLCKATFLTQLPLSSPSSPSHCTSLNRPSSLSPSLTCSAFLAPKPLSALFCFKVKRPRSLKLNL